MEKEKLTLFGGSLLWFGAAISITEMMTGALLAPLGMTKGILAIVIGHIIGCLLFYFFGLIGAKNNKGAMESTEISFGRNGSIFFSLFNVLQLIGWTAIMIISGAEAMDYVVGTSNTYLWCIVIGLLIMLWIFVGLKNISKISVFAVGLLFLLSIMLGFIVFNGDVSSPISSEKMTFGLALELSIAMPLSWLPLISDYTRNSDRPEKLTRVSSISYLIGSSFMYIIGLSAGINFATSDVIQILVSSGLGLSAMLIVIFSTVTTTFLDVYSAGESTVNIFKGLNHKIVCYIVCILGVVIAMLVPIFQYENFLYLLGSVFVPMAVVMICDYFINGNTEYDKNQSHINLILLCLGIIIYRVFLILNMNIGSTIPVVVIIMLISIVVGKIRKVGKNV